MRLRLTLFLVGALAVALFSGFSYPLQADRSLVATSFAINAENELSQTPEMIFAYLPLVVRPPQPPTATPTATATPTVTATATRTMTPSGQLEVTAWVSNSSPAKYSSVTVYGKIVQGDAGISGVPMHITWHYKTTTPTCDGTSGSDGVASCGRNIGNATSGYYVSITVEFTYGGQTYTAYTGFTPQ